MFSYGLINKFRSVSRCSSQLLGCAALSCVAGLHSLSLAQEALAQDVVFQNVKLGLLNDGALGDFERWGEVNGKLIAKYTTTAIGTKSPLKAGAIVAINGSEVEELIDVTRFVVPDSLEVTGAKQFFVTQLDNHILIGLRSYLSNGRANENHFWLTDGTKAGTLEISQAYPGSSQVYLKEKQKLLLFREENKVAVLDLVTFEESLLADLPKNEFNFVSGWSNKRGTRAYFSNEYFRENQPLKLWTTDGSSEGTYELANDVGSLPEYDGTNPRFEDSELLFTREITGSGFSVISDGTANGTALVKYPITPLTQDCYQRLGFDYSHGLHFQFGKRLVIPQCIRRGEVNLVAVIPGSQSTEVLFSGKHAIYGARSPLGIELYLSASVDIQLLGVINGQLLFQADDGVHGPALWRTDGTVQGTQLVANPSWSGIAITSPSIVANSGTMYFEADGEEELSDWSGNKEIPQWIWKTDGTSEGTRRVLNRVKANYYEHNLLKFDHTLAFFSLGVQLVPAKVVRDSIYDVLRARFLNTYSDEGLPSNPSYLVINDAGEIARDSGFIGEVGDYIYSTAQMDSGTRILASKKNPCSDAGDAPLTICGCSSKPIMSGPKGVGVICTSAAGPVLIDDRKPTQVDTQTTIRRKQVRLKFAKDSSVPVRVVLDGTSKKARVLHSDLRLKEKRKVIATVKQGKKLKRVVGYSRADGSVVLKLTNAARRAKSVSFSSTLSVYAPKKAASVLRTAPAGAVSVSIKK